MSRPRSWLLLLGGAIGVTVAVLQPIAAAKEAGVEVLRDVSYGDTPAMTLDAFVPTDGGAKRPAVILVHGGAWTGGDKQLFGAAGVRLARHGWVAFSVNYTLEPPRWPREVSDLQGAIGWVRENATRFGVDPEAIGLLGSSSGANLALLAATMGEGATTRGVRSAAVVSWSGPGDLESLVEDPEGDCASPELCQRRSDIPRTVREYLGCDLEACPDVYREASPLSHVDPSDPPMLLVNSTDELIPFEQAERMSDALTRSGVPNEILPVEGSAHGSEYAREVWEDSIAFLDRWLLRPPEGTPIGGAGLRWPWMVGGAAIGLAAIGAAAVAIRRRRA